MRKLLTTAAMLAMLAPAAFAQDKTPDQLREEANTIWNHDGIRQEKYTRVVISGTKTRLGFFHMLNPDCSARNDIAFRVTKEPEHGTIDTAAATDYAHYRKDTIRYKCNQQKVRGTEIKYKSADKYAGDDSAEVTVIFGDGFAWEVHYDIKVR
jgi:opacity protein-like surface antigen